MTHSPEYVEMFNLITRIPLQDHVLFSTRHAITKAILAAGWRTPARTVSTVEELDALPDGEAVVVTSGGVAFLKGDANMWITPRRWNEVDVWAADKLIRTGPLTVVHECGA